MFPDLLMKKEKAKYEKIWGFDEYRTGSPGLRKLKHLAGHTELKPGVKWADFGCGTGRAALMIREHGTRVYMVDIAKNCLNDNVRAALLPDWFEFHEGCLWDMPDIPVVDWFYCADVMEHIPEKKVSKVLSEIADRASKGGVFNIATYDDVHFAKLTGEQTHMTIKDAAWWIDKLSKHWDVSPIETTQLDVTLLVKRSDPSV